MVNLQLFLKIKFVPIRRCHVEPLLTYFFPFFFSFSFFLVAFSLSFPPFFSFVHQSDLCILATEGPHAPVRSPHPPPNSHQLEFHKHTFCHLPRNYSQSLVSLNFLTSFLSPSATFPTVLYTIVTNKKRGMSWYQPFSLTHRILTSHYSHRNFLTLFQPNNVEPPRKEVTIMTYSQQGTFKGIACPIWTQMVVYI